MGVPLDITVYRGRNIVSASTKRAEGSEPPNSYCTITYKKLAWSTLTVPKCTNPVWNTLTTFDDVNLNDPDSKIVVHLYDEINQKKHHLGSITIPLNPLREGQEAIDKWFPIDDSPFRGDIRVKIRPQRPPQGGDEPNDQKVVAPTASETNLNPPRKQENVDDDPALNPTIRKLRALQREKIENVDDMSTEQLLLETERLKQDSLQSTIRSMETLNQTKTIATDSMNKLEHQGNQLKSINRDLDLIDAHTDDTRRKIRGVRSIFGSAANLFSKNKSKEKIANISAAHPHVPPSEKKKKNHGHSEERRAIEKRNRLWGPQNRERSQSDPTVGNNQQEQPQGENPAESTEKTLKSKRSSVKSPTESEQLFENSQKTVQAQPEQEPDELDSHLSVISSAVADLKVMAMNIGSELEEQTTNIDQIGTKVEKNSAKIIHQTIQIQKKL